MLIFGTLFFMVRQYVATHIYIYVYIYRIFACHIGHQYMEISIENDWGWYELLVILNCLFFLRFWYSSDSHCHSSFKDTFLLIRWKKKVACLFLTYNFRSFWLLIKINFSIRLAILLIIIALINLILLYWEMKFSLVESHLHSLKINFTTQLEN